MAAADRPAGPPDFDLPSFAGRLGAALHRAGVPVTPERAALFLRALKLSPPVDRTALYWPARLAFVGSRDQTDAFDEVFDLVFGGLGAMRVARGDRHDPAMPDTDYGPRHARSVSSAPPASSAAITGGSFQSGGMGDGPTRLRESIASPTLGSSQEALATKDFGAFDAGDLAALDRLLGTLAVHMPVRRSRRRSADPHGRRVDMRRSLRRSLRTNGEPLRLASSSNRLRRRRLVLLCDISGSMEPYTRAYLRFFSRISSRAATGVATETFVFATRLTRLTRVLRHTDPDTALHRAGLTAVDWSSGTLIGRSLGEFTDSFGRRGLARGAVVVIFSDGWEGEDPARVGREMARLARLAHRIVWVNPRKAAPGYAPLAAGMAAALPFCDAFVSGHSLEALAEVVDAVAG